MKLLVFQQDNQLFAHMREHLDAREEEILPIPVTLDVIGTMVDLDALIEQHQPRFFISVALLAPDADKLSQKRFRANIEQIERVARREGIPFIFLSSAMVFDGKKLGYKESEPTSAQHPVAKVYAELEKLISRKSKKHIILRTSWLFSHKPHNFLTNVVDYACEQAQINVNSAAKGCPTAMEDLVRVLVAMVLQLDLDSDAWGTYHYASGDTAIGFQFVEAIVAQASQFDERIVPSHLPFAHDDRIGGEFYFAPVVLKCDRVRSAFGVHQKSWRQFISAEVKQYFSFEEADEVEETEE